MVTLRGIQMSPFYTTNLIAQVGIRIMAADAGRKSLRDLMFKHSGFW
jgi:hypothetical protein